MRKIAAALIGALMLIAAPAPAAAQDAVTLERALSWAQRQQALSARLLAALDGMPEMPADLPESARAAWSRDARQWAERFRAEADAIRIEARALQTLPQGLPPNLESVYGLQRDSFNEMLDGMDAFAARYAASLSALEEGDYDAAVNFAIAGVDGMLLLVRVLRDTNFAQADAISANNPQRNYLRSIGHSYDAMLAVSEATRAQLMGGGESNAAIAARVAAASLAMRGQIALGRSNAQGMARDLGDGSRFTPAEQPIARRVAAALETFDGSFDREMEIVSILDGIAALLRGNASYRAVEPEIDALSERLWLLDTARGEDIARRVRMMQAPPT
ncbi:MAG: hypothetical protein AB7J28_15280 [Hyphomonadaceae bacterium]